MSRKQTIYAVSSGRPPSAVAVVRISGPNAREALKVLCGRVPDPRRAMFARLRGHDGEVIDEALALWFPAPASETGEDIVELQTHGGRAVIARVFQELSRLDDFRPAEPGEFTRRAVMNGKLDLTSAEGLLDLINADTEGQRRVALRHLRGQLGLRAEEWRRRIIEAMALVEAGIDFSDEGDVPETLIQPALIKASALRAEIAAALADGGRGERLRDGLVVAIAGAPNAGKSTLMNALARRDVAIVSPIAGTTRDVIEVHLDLGGWPVTLLDTAGIRDSDDVVEQEGVRRARARLADADVVLWLTDLSDETADALPPGMTSGGALWRVGTKADLAAASPAFDVCVSAATGSGLGDLIAALGRHAEAYFGEAERALIIRQRQRDLLTDAAAYLERAAAASDHGEEVIAEELRAAAFSLGKLTGRVDVEDILDVVFRDFCIGK